MAKTKSSTVKSRDIIVSFSSARLAKEALEKANSLFLPVGSCHISRRDGKTIYFPKGISATFSDAEVERFLRNCDGSLS